MPCLSVQTCFTQGDTCLHNNTICLRIIQPSAVGPGLGLQAEVAFVGGKGTPIILAGGQARASNAVPAGRRVLAFPGTPPTEPPFLLDMHCEHCANFSWFMQTSSNPMIANVQHTLMYEGPFITKLHNNPINAGTELVLLVVRSFVDDSYIHIRDRKLSKVMRIMAWLCTVHDIDNIPLSFSLLQPANPAIYNLAQVSVPSCGATFYLDHDSQEVLLKICATLTLARTCVSQVAANIPNPGNAPNAQVNKCDAWMQVCPKIACNLCTTHDIKYSQEVLAKYSEDGPYSLDCVLDC